MIDHPFHYPIHIPLAGLSHKATSNCKAGQDIHVSGRASRFGERLVFSAALFPTPSHLFLFAKTDFSIFFYAHLITKAVYSVYRKMITQI